MKLVLFFSLLWFFSRAQDELIVAAAVIQTGLTAGLIRFRYHGYTPEGYRIRSQILEGQINADGVATIALNVARASLRRIFIKAQDILRISVTADVQNGDPGNIPVDLTDTTELVQNIVAWTCGANGGDPIPDNIEVRFLYELRRKLTNADALLLPAPSVIKPLTPPSSQRNLQDGGECAADSYYLRNYDINAQPAEEYTDFSLDLCQEALEISSYTYASFVGDDVCRLFATVTDADYVISENSYLLISGGSSEPEFIKVPSQAVNANQYYKRTDHYLLPESGCRTDCQNDATCVAYNHQSYTVPCFLYNENILDGITSAWFSWVTLRQPHLQIKTSFLSKRSEIVPEKTSLLARINPFGRKRRRGLQDQPQQVVLDLYPIADIKREVQEATGHEAVDQEIIIQDAVLEDGLTLQSYGIVNGTEVTVNIVSGSCVLSFDNGIDQPTNNVFPSGDIQTFELPGTSNSVQIQCTDSQWQYNASSGPQVLTNDQISWAGETHLNTTNPCEPCVEAFGYYSTGCAFGSSNGGSTCLMGDEFVDIVCADIGTIDCTPVEITPSPINENSPVEDETPSIVPINTDGPVEAPMETSDTPEPETPEPETPEPETPEPETPEPEEPGPEEPGPAPAPPLVLPGNPDNPDPILVLPGNPGPVPPFS